MSNNSSLQAQEGVALVQAELAKSLTAAFASMTGDSSIVLTPALGNIPGDFGWVQLEFEPLPKTALYLGLSSADTLAIGHQLLIASGLEGETDETAIGTLHEVFTQGASPIASLLGSRSKKSVSVKLVVDPPPPEGAPHFGFQITGVGSQTIPLVILASDALLELLVPKKKEEPPAAVPFVPGPPTSIVPALPKVNNLELLLDVEMPVSISFGRAELPLKDVLKLGTGSLIELNRGVSDLVDIIVNNSVIARGEVVVVEGNFGVRIKQVMSKQERLQNLV
jgi:flagellar motor switch protein FliN/FliY